MLLRILAGRFLNAC